MSSIEQIFEDVRKQNLLFIFQHRIHKPVASAELYYHLDMLLERLKKAVKKRKETKHLCYEIFSVVVLIGVLLTDENIGTRFEECLFSNSFFTHIKILQKYSKRFNNWRSIYHYESVFKLALGLFHHFDCCLTEYGNKNCPKQVLLTVRSFNEVLPYWQ